MAGFTLEHQVGHELHLYRDDACSFTFLASSTLGVEREVLGSIPHLARKGLGGKQLPDGIVCLDVGGRIGPGGFANRILVDKLDVLDGIHVALKGQILSWQIGNLVESALQCGIEYTLDERALTRTRHTGDDGHDIERYLYVYASEVVHAGALDRQGAIPWTARCGYGYCLFTGKIFHGIRLRIVLDGSLRQLGHIAFEDDASSMLACIGTDIYQVVGGTHDFFVVLYHYNGIAQLL